ncbi:hypothetical protein PLICRDRAFT_101118 [Plicaturopsis crispa FD-325 SS-3]|nr:hypothetical protein PLICRDRAFT_101118 [Plicaturopsis crispa FD-325 SS-3]
MSTPINFGELAGQIKLDVLSKTQDIDNAAQRKEISRNFVSDTVTAPSKEMYAYAALASIGDDVFGDSATRALEEHIAKLAGKEAALYMTSGTASNQIALRTHLKQPPYSVLCDHRSHINKYEGGGAAFHSGATTLAIIPANGHHLTLDDVEINMVVGNDIHIAPTEVVALENTLNGTIFPQDEIVKISDFVHAQGAKMHLDGARIWHVAAETGLSIKELCDPFDSVSMCFSKGLGAPIGSCLTGTQEFITKARWFRKVFGGGLRQTGILTASAAYALTHNFPKLPAVHALAKYLQKELEVIGADILSRAETSMVFYDPEPLGVTYDEILERGSQLPEPLKLRGSRLTLHIETSKEAVDDLLAVIRELAEEKKKAGWVRPQSKPKTNGLYKDVYVRSTKKAVKKA